MKLLITLLVVAFHVSWGWSRLTLENYLATMGVGYHITIGLLILGSFFWLAVVARDLIEAAWSRRWKDLAPALPPRWLLLAVVAALAVFWTFSRSLPPPPPQTWEPSRRGAGRPTPMSDWIRW